MKFVQLILFSLSYFITPVSTRFNCAEEDYCLNRGICEGIVVGAETVVTKCLCNHMYTGPRCEYKKCSRDPCQNGGFCELVGRSLFRCHCQQGFRGDFCQIKIPNACDFMDCGNHGKCLLLDGSFEEGACECDPGYAGDNCEFDIDDCEDNHCSSGSTCVDKVDGYECVCPEGRFGKFCQHEDRCLTRNPCVHGDCYSTADGVASCFCNPGFTGPNCDEDINECELNPCGEYGICINSLGGYTCECSPEFTGAHCDEELTLIEENFKLFLMTFVPCFFILFVGFWVYVYFCKSGNVVYTRTAFGISLFAFCCLSVSTTASLVWLIVLSVQHDRSLEFNFMVAIVALQLLNIVFHCSLLKYKNQGKFLCRIACVVNVGTIYYLIAFVVFHLMNEVPDNHLFKVIPIATVIGFVHCLLIAANINALRMIGKNKGQWRETGTINNLPFSVSSSDSANSVCGLKSVNPTRFANTGIEKDELTPESIIVTPQVYFMSNSRHIARRVLKFSSTVIEQKETVPRDNPSATIVGTETNISDYPDELNPFEKDGCHNPFNDQYSEMPGSKSGNDLSSVFLSDVTPELSGLSSESLAELHTTRELPEPRALTPNATSTPKYGFRRSQRQMKYIDSV